MIEPGALRTLGIPARYVSGYLVPHADTPRSDQRLLSLHDHLRDVLNPRLKR